MSGITSQYSHAEEAEETQKLLLPHEKKETIPSAVLSVTVDVASGTDQPPNWIDLAAGDPGCKRACSHCIFNVGPWVTWVSALCIGGGIRVMIELHYNQQYWSMTNVTLAGAALVVFIVIYLISVVCSETGRKVCGAISKGQLEDKLQILHQNAPTITWHMECYHNDDNHVEVIYSKGSTWVETTKKKIVTWSGTKSFDFQSWKDVTHPFQLAESGSYQFISIHKKYIFADEETQAAYESQKQSFINEQKHRDLLYTIKESFVLDGFQENVVAAISTCTCTTSRIVYAIMVLLLLAYPWSFLVKKGERRLDYHCVKMVSACHKKISIAHVALPPIELNVPEVERDEESDNYAAYR